MRVSLGVGLGGLATTLVLTLAEPRPALASYHLGFTYWVGIAVASLLLLQIFHACGARWMISLRRVLELQAVSVAALAVLFLPIAIGMGELFVWVHPSADLGRETLARLSHRRPYLNVPFFLARSAGYFGAWIAVSQLLFRWSNREDTAGDERLSARQRRLGAGSLPLLALTLTFAAIDWVMSLDPVWYSTIFGVYYFAGSLLAALSLLCIVAILGERNLLSGRFTSDQQHNLGKLLLAFVAFWAYIAFSQLLLVWIGNLPEEVPWYRLRMTGSWGTLGAFLLVGHFVVPFFLLLSRPLKLAPRALLGVAVWILLVHYADLYWLLMPSLREGPFVRASDAAAFAGVGGVSIAFAIHALRGRYPVPVGALLAETTGSRAP